MPATTSWRRLRAYGGRPPYTWSIASGALPPGSALNATTGVISGVLNAAGTYSFSVQVADSLGATASATKSITVVGGSVATPVSVVEFYNASLDHYFITYVADEIAKLDNGTFKGWARTGLVVQRLRRHPKRHVGGLPHLHPAGQG